MDTSHENRERVSHAHLPRVVIVGGGFGGLYAARGLARAPVTVTDVSSPLHTCSCHEPLSLQIFQRPYPGMLLYPGDHPALCVQNLRPAA